MAASLITHETVAIGVGAVCGALSRYQCGRIFGEWIAAADTAAGKAAGGPNSRAHLAGWHTAFINLGGSFMLGGVVAAPSRAADASSTTAAKLPFSTQAFGLTPRLRLMLGVGFCGSFTTFSTYSVDIVTWITQGHTGKALSYVMVNNVGGVVAAAAGMALVKKLFG
jgi:fluoride ion exporter CrcB/FEX